jgi:DNA polymerase III gamma/tau subunit
MNETAQTCELYKTHRPTTFDEIVGQDAAVSVLTKMVEKNRVPHAILFSGPSGCGKTTLAYILSAAIDCHPDEFEVIDSGQFKGIDSARELRERLYYSARRGKIRVFLIDECFPAGTKIVTPSGVRNIEDMCVGDSLLSLHGEDQVTQLHKITLPLSRLVRVSLVNGSSIVCSDWHLFLTPEGWVSAGELQNTDYVLLLSCDILLTNSPQQENKHVQGNTEVSDLRQAISHLPPQSAMLQQELCGKDSLSDDFRSLSCLPKASLAHGGKEGTTGILQSPLRGERQDVTSRTSGSIVQRDGSTEDFQNARGVSKDSGGTRTGTVILSSDDSQQSKYKPPCVRKDNADAETQRYVACLAGNPRGERAFDSSSKDAGPSSGLADGSGNTAGRADKGLPDVLQGGHWEPKTEGRNRSRWQMSSDEENAIKGLEERGEVIRVGVGCVEILQLQNSDRHGGGSEGHPETSEIEMYDLSVKNHPSYFANNILVHNCHEMTGPQMDAMLKVMEDTPKHVYIWLATTDPDKLKKAIQTRCTKIEVSSISPEDMAKKVLWPICVKEERNTDEIKPVLLHIANHCGGSARAALVQLDAVWDLESPEAQLEALKKMTVDDEKVENLVKMLLAKAQWMKIGPALNNLDGEPESIRWGVLGYCSAGARGWLCMNPTQVRRCAEIMVCFEKNYYDSRAAGLTLSCMYACGVL